MQNLKKRFKGFVGNQNKDLKMDKVLADQQKLASVLADNRRFSMVPKAVLQHNLSLYDWKVLIVLCLYSNYSGVAYPTHETIEHLTGFSKTAIIASLKRLESMGLMRSLKSDWFENQKSKWKTNRYQILYNGKETPIPTDQELKDAIPYNWLQDETEKPAISIGQDQDKDIARDIKGKQLIAGFNKLLNIKGLHAETNSNLKASYQLLLITDNINKLLQDIENIINLDFNNGKSINPHLSYYVGKLT